MRPLLLAIIWSLAVGLASAGSDNTVTPSVKVVNFTADWCPNCQILNPRLDEAIERFDDGLVKRIDLDLTKASRRAPQPQRMKAFAGAIQTAEAHQAAYLWDWYGGVTGIAVFISADNGEPLSCINRSLSVDDMEQRLKQAVLLADHGTPGERQPNGPDCPAPMR